MRESSRQRSSGDRMWSEERHDVEENEYVLKTEQSDGTICFEVFRSEVTEGY
jgi:hypothetical protein